MKKNILIVGNNPNAYALAKKLSEKHNIFVAPKSDGLKEFTTCLDIREDDINSLLDFAMENEIDMTIALSQKAIDEDISTRFNQNNQQIFAPSAAANYIVSNKAYAKKIMYKLKIPTPKFGIFDKINLAVDYIKSQQTPFVIKTNDTGSAVILTSEQCAKNILETTFLDKNNKIIIEDYVYGTPFAFYVITDGYKALPIGSSIMYKHILEGDGGQVTSGMGSCVPNYKLSLAQEEFLMRNSVYPVLNYLQNGNNAYLGILGVNGILSEDGSISVLGWQSFTQDADTNGILNQLDEDIYSLFESCIIGSFSDEIDFIRQNNTSSASVVLRCSHKNNQENAIKGVDNIEDETQLVFYPNIKKNKYLEFEAEYGPVCIVTSSSSNASKAAEKVYKELKDLDFNGINYRKDICSVDKLS